MRALFTAIGSVLLAAGCGAILGIDQDYVLVGSGGHGAGGSGGDGGTTSGGGMTSGTGGGPGGQGGTAGGGVAGAGGTGGAGGGGTVQTVVYVATVADCIDTGSPDPDQCASPAEALWTDLPDTHAYLRFETDGTIAGATIVSATLRLTVGTYNQAQGDTSGELWEVAPFTRPDLFNGPPATVGSMVAGDQGVANPGTTVDWPVPASLIAASSPVFLSVAPISYNSVGYVNLSGTNPPRLIVEYQ